MSQLILFLIVTAFIILLLRKKKHKPNTKFKPSPVSKSFSRQPARRSKFKRAPQKKVRKKSENPQWGRVARTTNNYILKNDGTAIDTIISQIRSELNIDEGVKTKVSGLSSKPRRETDHWGDTEANISSQSGKTVSAQKMYKLGFEFLPEDLSISEGQFPYDPNADFVETVLKPLHKHLREHFYQFRTVEKYVSKITGRFRSNGKVSVWMSVWCTIGATEAYHHLVRFRTSLMKVNPSITIQVLGQELAKSNFSISQMYDDYEVQSKIFSRVHEQLYDALGVDPIKWKNQELLATFIRSKFKKIKTEYSPKWLGKQRIDIYIPSLKLAIEYQGIQHYEPVSVFGGEEGFKKTLLRDKRKLELANKNGIRLLYWHYSIEVNEQNVEKFLLDNNVNFAKQPIQ